MRITGPLELDVLQRSLDTVIACHDALRTRFAAVDGRPMREVMASLRLPLDVVPVRDLEHALQCVIEDGSRPFDLARGPVVRARLLRLSDTDHVLSLIVHHIAIDDASGAIVMRELAAGCSDRPQLRTRAPAGAIPVDDAVVAAALEYWKHRLAGFAPPPLPAEPPAAAVPGHRAGQIAVEAPAELTAGLRKLARQAKVTPFMVLAAALELVISRMTGQFDVAIGTVISTRDAEPDQAVGLRSNAVVLRAQVSPSLTFRELLAQVRGTVAGAWSHVAAPFEHVVRALDIPRASDRNPLFDVMFSYDTELPAVDAPGGLAFQLLDIAPPWCKYDLALHARDKRDHLRLAWVYRVDRFPPDTVQRIAGRYRRVLEQVVANPDLRLDALDPLAPEDRTTAGHRVAAQAPAPRAACTRWSATTRRERRTRSRSARAAPS